MVEGCNIGDTDTAAASIGAIAAQSAISEPHGRHVRDAGNLLALVLQPDERSPDRNAAHKTARAVNRIDDPAVAACAGRVAGFLAEEGVVGKFVEQSLTQKRLSFTI